MKKILILLVFALTTNIINAQTDADALRYAGSSITGSARFTAMSGAFNALGGDFSSISVNPAGLGIYRTNEFTLSPSIYSGSTQSTFLNNTSDDNKMNFNFGNVGLVFTNPLSKDASSPGWKSWSFGLGYNRIHNFHNRSFYEGRNRNNSLLDAFVENANGLAPENLDAYYEDLAYNAYLLNPDTSTTNMYTSVIPFGPEIQRRTSETRGSIGETVFAFAGNYSNKFYIGGSLNFRSLRYTEETTYEEADPDTSIPYFKSFQFEQNITTRGNGFNIKLGLIYKATDNVRLGASIHTPTWYTLRDEYNNTMTANLDTGSLKLADSPIGAYEYNFSTPLRMNAGIGLIIGQMGLVSADFDYTDFSNMRFSSDPGAFTPTNNIIRKKYTSVQTVRIGTEWRYETFSFRGGASFSTSPFESSFKLTGNDYSRKSFSGGIGLRENNFFLDLGYIFSTSNEYFQPYSLSNSSVEGVRTTVNSHNFVLTTGWKF
jgi:hypothetical protein